ncbi:MAG: hypothetical protein N2V75_10640 [Methanophagales archaeon]|nr:hypothetical protein [Methanophagales archaeon]
MYLSVASIPTPFLRHHLMIMKLVGEEGVQKPDTEFLKFYAFLAGDSASGLLFAPRYLTVPGGK